MEGEFGYLVSPIAFNIQVSIVDGCGWSIDAGYGSPEAENVKQGMTRHHTSSHHVTIAQED